jgi:CheY-like chemotaxis protein/anti-sigma regulatory factor (Ser/Thr protein kinase)
LLDTARALSGKLSVSLEACEPGEPIQAAISDIRPLAWQKGLTLEVILQETPLVQADPKRMRQVVSNLLSNAVKFTPPGGKVEVRLEPERGGVCIVVQDTGRGFPSEFQPLLFSPFRQEEEGTTRANGGLGLGLAIVRQLVELQGGTVWADSPGRGQGATFTVWIPSHEEPTEDPHAEAANHLELQLQGLRLLLVEDDALTRTAMASLLEQQGARVEAAESAAAALAALRDNVFDALVCDIAMPGEDGYSFIRKVRAMDGPPGRVPAAAFTAHMREEDRRHALLAGFQMHIPKSVEASQLIAQIRTLVGGLPPES